jgi:hypothetical protein
MALSVFAGIAIGFASGVYALHVAVAISLLFVLPELFAWRSGLGGDRAHAQAFLWDESPADPALRAAWRERRPPPATLGDGRSKPPRDIVLRVETTDIDDGTRVVDQVLGVAATKWRLRRSTPNASKAIVLEYECRLRRAYTPDEVRTLLLYHGEPFVRSAEWDK